ncbi:hypothetical protein SLA2020_134100 [Shorea laevis]
MGRGKIEIKKIENTTNRQVTYSKRRNGIFKKAQELTVLCDAKVSLIMFSSTGKFHEFISPSITTKEFFYEYQKTAGVDLWSSHYEKMQENYKRLKDINNKLRREIRQMMGEDLNGMSIKELQTLEGNMAHAADKIRNRKLHVIKTQTETYRKKVRNQEQRHGNLLLHWEAKHDDPHYGLVDNEGDYEIALANGSNNLYSFRLHNMNHHHGGRLEDLRLA